MRTIFLVFALMTTKPIAFAKSVELKKVNITMNLKNDAPSTAIQLTSASTYLSCVTKYSEGFGESGTEENSVEPQARITALPERVEYGSQSMININVEKEEKLSSPKRFLYQSKECELSLGLNINITDSDTGLNLYQDKFIYGAGININQGFPLIGTANKREQNLKIDKDFSLDMKVKAKYAGTRYSSEEKKQVPYCKLGLFLSNENSEVQVGYIFADLNAKFCEIPQSPDSRK